MGRQAGRERHANEEGEGGMKTALFPFVVLVHAVSMLMGMASLSFLVFTGRLSTLVAVVLLGLTASLAVTSSKLALVFAAAMQKKPRRRGAAYIGRAR